jgi:hypothetical protein
MELSLLSSRLMSMQTALGSSWISDGNVNDFGVFSGGSSGFWVGMVSKGSSRTKFFKAFEVDASNKKNSEESKGDHKICQRRAIGCRQ